MWASHLGLQAIILPIPTSRSVNYAKVIQQLISKSTYQQYWLTIPLTQGLHYQNSLHTEKNCMQNEKGSINVHGIDDSMDGWQLWDKFRHLCGHTSRLLIALEIPEDLPDSLDSLARWRGEPVKAAFLSTRLFLTNKTGFPVLSKRHQQFLCMLLEYKVQVIIRGRCRHSHGMSSYILYIRHLVSRSPSLPAIGNGNGVPSLLPGGPDSSSADDKVTQAYRDYLQAPLQPLMDNLESQTYEVFERDPVKYQQYEDAIALALTDMHTTRSEAAAEASDSMDQGLSVTIAVVGAGRGPLVKCALDAAARTHTPVQIYAIEKNANAVVTLRNRCISEGWSNVEVVAVDMRTWKPAQLADILVSELLGSWGDNELSPECLDGAQICLKPGGVSIPTSYTSFLAPISSSTLWTNARGLLDGKGLETPYVVKLHSCYQLDRAQPLFTFTHPQNTVAPPDNSRYASLSFTASHDVTMHGFAGTFFSSLYRHVHISIEPSTHSPGMFSWFPLFIPLAVPVSVRRADVVTVHVWRCVDDRKVWYEWCLSSPACTPIQNANGRSYWIGL